MMYVGIDPSTKTGICVIDDEGKVHLEKEITTNVKDDPQRFMDIAEKVVNEFDILKKKVCIEGFSYGSKGAGVSTQYGIGWAIRSEMVRRGISYIEVPPSSLKKFATGKGNCKKEDMILPIFKRWSYENDSDNIRDAFILSQIARALEGECELVKYQEEALKKVSG